MPQTTGLVVQAGGWSAILLGFASKIQPWVNLLLVLVMIVLGCMQIYAHIRRNRKADRLYKEMDSVRYSCEKAISGNCPLEKRISELEKEGLKLK